MGIKKETLDLQEIILKYKPLVGYRVKKSLGSFTPDWEDVVADIMMNVVESVKKGKFKGESSISTFIYTITTRRIVDYIREKAKSPKYIPEPSLDFNPYGEVEKKERLELLENCLKKLDPRSCDVLYSHYYADLSQSEIAQIFGISLGRVAVLISHARKLLKDVLESYEPVSNKKRSA